MNRSNNILFCILVFMLQVIISDYLNPGPYLYICLIPFLTLNVSLRIRPNIFLAAAFGTGLLLDILSGGVVGLNAAAAVATAASRTFFYRIFVNSDRQDSTEIPYPGTIGTGKYMKLLAAVTMVYMAVYVTLECVSFRPFGFILAKFISSTAANVAAAMLLTVSYKYRD